MVTTLPRSPVSALAILMSDMWLNCVDIKSSIIHRVLYSTLFIIGEGFELLQLHTWLCHSLFYSVGSTVMNFSWNYCQAAHGRNVWKACRNYWRICTSCWGKFLEHAQPERSQVSVETHRQHAMLPHTHTDTHKQKSLASLKLIHSIIWQNDLEWIWIRWGLPPSLLT